MCQFFLDRGLIAQRRLPVCPDAVSLKADQFKGGLCLVDVSVHELVNGFLVGEDLGGCGGVILVELSNDTHRAFSGVDVAVDGDAGVSSVAFIKEYLHFLFGFGSHLCYIIFQ